jgi:hypothetical protein
VLSRRAVLGLAHAAPHDTSALYLSTCVCCFVVNSSAVQIPVDKPRTERTLKMLKLRNTKRQSRNSDQLPIVITFKNSVALVWRCWNNLPAPYPSSKPTYGFTRLEYWVFLQRQRHKRVITPGCGQGSACFGPIRAPDAISHHFPPFPVVMICETHKPTSAKGLTKTRAEPPASRYLDGRSPLIPTNVRLADVTFPQMTSRHWPVSLPPPTLRGRGLVDSDKLQLLLQICTVLFSQTTRLDSHRREPSAAPTAQNSRPRNRHMQSIELIDPIDLYYTCFVRAIRSLKWR